MFRTLFFVFFNLLILHIQAHDELKPLVSYNFNNGKLYNGTASGEPKLRGYSLVEDRFGNEASSVYLHGNSESYINLGTSSVLKPQKGSISLWLNVDIIVLKGSGFEYNPILLTKSHGGDDYYEGYFIGLNYNSKRLNVTTSKDSLNQITLNSRQALSLREWHHIVMTYDDDYLALYIDNKREAKLPKKFKSVFLEGDSVILGSSANQKNERCFCGSIDDICFFDRVLNEEEIAELYDAPDPNRLRRFFNVAGQIAALVLLVVLLVWFITSRYRATLKKEQEKNKVDALLNELENKAIRSQMNPHFMFNSLNTLQRFILEKDIENAHVYLTKFSRLLRKILESNTGDSISLEEEINILDNYIELENLRSDNSFHYTINNEVKESITTLIPFMLIQPFVENAIWHGLMAKKTERLLTISFSYLDETRIRCVVDDNGIGREQSVKYKDPFKKKSLASEFIRQRLELIQKSTGIACSYEITDKHNEVGESSGTQVTILLPKLNVL